MLKLRNPGWPPEGASGSPVSVLMPGHIAPKDERKQRRQRIKEAATGRVSLKRLAKLRHQLHQSRCGLCVEAGVISEIDSTAPKHSKASKAK